MAAPSQDAFRVARLEENPGRAVPRLTGRGAAVLAAGLMLLLAGLLTRDGDMVALGIGAVMLLVPMAMLAWWNLQRIDLAAQLPARVTAEERFDCRLRVRNHRPLGDAFQVSAEQQLPGGGTLRFHAPWTAAQDESEVLLDGSVPRRGVFGGGQVLLNSTFPLGLFRVQARGQMAESMLVMPRPLIPPPLEDPCLATEADESRTEQTRWPSLGELHGLRAYQPGDPLRFIHWPASSRGVGLIVREFDRPRFQPRMALVVFHSSSSERAILRPENFESALRLLAGAVWRLGEQQIPVEIRADFLAWQPVRCADPREFHAFHASLAKIHRAKTTQIAQWTPMIHAAPTDAMILVVSDLPLAGWEPMARRAAGRRLIFTFDPAHAGMAKPARIPKRKGAPA